MTDLSTLQQHQLLMKLLGLSREQWRALADDNLDQFVDLMDEREGVMADLVAVEAAPPPPANVLPFPTIVASGADPDVRAAMGGLIRSILRQDDENEALLRRQMDDIKSEIGLLARRRTAGRGYAASTGTRWMGQAVDRAG